MSPVAVVVIVVLALLMFLVAVVGRAHGRLTGLLNSLRNAFQRVDEQLGRGHETAGALLAGLDPGEAAVEAAAKARDAAESARAGIEEAPEDPAAAAALAAAERDLDSALGALPVSGGEEIEANRDRLAFACEKYNETVAQYTRYRGRFPGSLAARIFHLPAATPVHMSKEGAD